VFSGLFLPPRKTVCTVAGKPVDLSAWIGKERSGRALREATAAIMHDVAGLVGELRGQQPPAELYDGAKADAAKVEAGGAKAEADAGGAEAGGAEAEAGT
jgi:hypothetical protein